MPATELSVSARRLVSPVHPQHNPASAPPHHFRCRDEALLAVGSVEHEIDALTAGEPGDFGRDVVVPVIEHVVGAHCLRQGTCLCVAAAADDRSRAECLRLLNGQMADAAATARNIDGIARSQRICEGKVG